MQAKVQLPLEDDGLASQLPIKTRHQITLLERLSSHLLAHVLDHLMDTGAGNSIVLLAHTSKTMMLRLYTDEALKPRTYHFEPLTREQRASFLTILERDIPTHMLCTVCVRLHPIQADDCPWKKNGMTPIRNTCNVSAGHFRIFGAYDIWFHHVQAAMKRQYYRRGHGISVRALSGSVINPVNAWNPEMSDGPMEPDGIFMYATTIGHDLSLNATLRVSGNDVDDLKTHLRRYTLAICPHLRVNTLPRFNAEGLSRKVNLEYLNLINKTIKELNSRKNRSRRSSKLVECHVCWTRVMTTYWYTPGNKPRLEIAASTLLGAGRSHHDPRWSAFVDENAPDKRTTKPNMELKDAFNKWVLTVEDH
ncbi:hypothetical protein M501DRAFT_995505 [Patellaria atrata CBS 101060]|uniref:Uncharacterized protein n=1 Tax=Patellaria atrata CBS 101060 TaxID=1346257 RepID=A0A9P4S7I6_9PEZI|nr:hypothetical protein M501DRAFT_995505 [Patellaria atrata CBS 101060]